MALKRSYNRLTDSLRPVTIQPHYYDYAEGSCLISYGNTQVICVATVEDSAPPHMRGSGRLWVTGEYNMLPRSSPQRIKRERDKVGGRTQEIQRLIGRALRSIVNNEGLGDRTLIVDCDVLRADGGTRTASITGAFVAMCLALRKIKSTGRIAGNMPFPVKDYLSAVSVGVVQGQPVLDLDYPEDSNAETDMNLVMTGKSHIVEVQGTAEKEAFSRDEFNKLLDLAQKGCDSLCQMQREVLGPLDWTGGKPA
jgi:ribonuclease PH